MIRIIPCKYFFSYMHSKTVYGFCYLISGHTAIPFGQYIYYCFLNFHGYLSFCGSNHKRYSYHSNGDSDNNVCCQWLAKHKSTDDNSSYRFEYT